MYHLHCKYRLQLEMMFNFSAIFGWDVLKPGWIRDMLLQLGFLKLRHWSRGSLNDLYALCMCVSVYVGMCVHVLHSETVSKREKNQWDQCNRDRSISICRISLAQTHMDIYLPYTHSQDMQNMHTFLHFCTHTLLSPSPLHSLCTQSRLLICSLRALLSVCVTFHPSTHHFLPHHQIAWKQSSTNSPFIQRFIQSSHGLRWHSASSTFHHLHIIMRQYAALQ